MSSLRYLSWILVVIWLLSACAPTTLTPVSDIDPKRYSGEATILLAVAGNSNRGIRHIEIVSNEAHRGFELYFRKAIVKKGFITLVTTSSNYLKLLMRQFCS